MKNCSKNNTFAIGVALLFAVFLLGLPSFSRAANQFAIGIGLQYASGDYGSDTTTDSLRIPLTLDYYPTERLDFELVVPFVHQNNTNTLVSGGTRFSFDGHHMGGMHSAGFDTTESQSGLGDVTLTAGYLLVKRDDSRPGVRPLLYLKFPTADEDDGLGTGEFDIGAGVGAVQWFGRWYTFGEVRYIFQGSNSDFDLEDYATLEAKLGYRMSDRFLPSISLWTSTPPSEESSSLAEARLNGIYWVADDLSVEGYLGTGLSSDSADFGAGFSVSRSF